MAGACVIYSFLLYCIVEVDFSPLRLVDREPYDDEDKFRGIILVVGLFVCLFVCLVNCFDVASVACSLFAQFSYEGL